jgi:hypothetical protein
MCLNLLLETLSFSDYTEKASFELSSASSTSGSDSNRSNIHYVSKADDSGVAKITKAKEKKNKQQLKILCNKKMYYFLQKYAELNAGKSFIIYNIRYLSFKNFSYSCSNGTRIKEQTEHPNAPVV